MCCRQITNYADVKSVQSEAWTTILHNNITLPTPRIKLFDPNAKFIAWKSFAPENTPMPDATDPTNQTNQQREESIFGLEDPTNRSIPIPTDQTNSEMEEPIQINKTEPNATDPQDDQMVYITENLPIDLEETGLQPLLPSMGSQETPQTSSESHDKTSSAEDSFKTKVANAYYRILGPFHNGDTYKKIEELSIR